MDFSKMRHRIVFLRPDRKKDNTFGETVPLWVPFIPAGKSPDTDIYLDTEDGPPVFRSASGTAPYTDVIKKFAVWAFVRPMTGREYEESQKLREETTYDVVTRYFPGITAEMKIFYRDRVLDILSVLNIDEADTELRIVAKERDTYGKETD